MLTVPVGYTLKSFDHEWPSEAVPMPLWSGRLNRSWATPGGTGTSALLAVTDAWAVTFTPPAKLVW